MSVMFVRLVQSGCLSHTNVESASPPSLAHQFSRKVCLLVLRIPGVKVKLHHFSSLVHSPVIEFSNLISSGSNVRAKICTVQVCSMGDFSDKGEFNVNCSS